MDNKDKELIQEIKNNFSPDVKKSLRRIIAFGSRVTGEAREDSDLDIIALLDEKKPDYEKNIDDIAYQVMWNHDFKPIISIKVFSETQFDIAVKKGFSFYTRVEREGISL